MSEPPSSTEEAVEHFLAARRRGERLDPAEFAARHPELGPELESALDALLALERATQDHSEDVLPERIGAFRVVREIGRGGMGVVLEAVEEPLHRRVALKVLPPELLASASARARFRREAELAARLDHSGIATVYGAGVEGDRPWIAMRYVEGSTLARSISAARSEGASSVRLGATSDSARASMLALASCLARVARALQSAHEQGVVHRDVKPSNIIVASDGTPVLLDFGLAIAEETDGHSLTRTGETAGTPAYLAPEVLSGERARPDVQSDVYALGVTLYECLALRRPFDAPTPVALYRAILSDATPDVRAANRAVPRDLAIVVATAMERDRARRYRSAAALADDLEACAGGRPISARPVPLFGRVLRWARREPRQAVLAGLLAVATLSAAALAGTWWQSRAEVHAAERLTNAQRYEDALRQGYGDLAVNWFEEADADFAQALALVPHDAEAIAGRAFIRLKRKRDAEALAVLADAPATPAFASLRALASGKLPEVEQPKEWFASASAIEMFIDGMRLTKQKERSPRHEQQRLAALALERFDEAIRRSHATRMFYHLQRAQAAADAQDEAAIRSAAADLIVLWPNQGRAYMTAGEVLYRVDAAASIPLLRRAVELDPQMSAPLQLLGNALAEVKDFEGSAQALRRALEIEPTDSDAWNSLGLTLEELHCPDEARATYVCALAIRSRFEFWGNLAVLDAKGADRATAEQELRLALGFDPRESLLLIPLARLLHDQGKTREALAQLEIVIGFDARNGEAWELFAECQEELGDADTAALARELAQGH